MAQSTEKYIVETSDKILDALLDHKRKNPEFTFWLRKREMSGSKENRLAKGYWFQGSHYIWVAFYRGGDRHNKTRTFGFVINAKDPERPVNYIEWVFNFPREGHEAFYKNLSKIFPAAEKLHDRKFRSYYQDTDIFKNLDYFLNVEKPKIDKLINELGLQEGLFIPEARFQESLSKTLGYREMLKDTSKKTQTVGLEGIKYKHDAHNIILFGPPGTGKTYNSINHALSIIEGQWLANYDEIPREELRQKFETYKANGQVEVITFHQSLSYEDFIEGIKPDSEDDSGGSLVYRVMPGIFKQIVARAKFQERDNFDSSYDKFITDVGEESIELLTLRHKKPFKLTINSADNCTVRPMTETGTRMVVTKEMISQYLRTGEVRDWKPYLTSIAEHLKKRYDYKAYKAKDDPSSKNFVLIIDEINRGNIAQIFGELITLIEKDKRLGAPEQVEVTLPYSKEKFGVPANLYIIGTMNTADRSVEALDTALRRRFSFVEMPPLYDLEDLDEEWFGISLSELLRTVNKRLEKLLSKDHLIGHSYFLTINTDDDLKSAFQNKLIPLLQEYFYGDFGKIGLVLGEGFLDKLEDSSTDRELFAEFGNYDASDLLEKPVYRLKNISAMSDDEFAGALNLLMRRTQ